MDFEKMLGYLKADSMGDVDLQQIEKYIDAVCSIEFVAKWEQEDFIASFQKVIAKKIGLYSACDYNVYHVGYVVALEQLAKRKHELREVLQDVDTRELYLPLKEIESKEIELKKLDIIEDITLLLQDFTDMMQLERISNQMDRLNYSRYHGDISSEELIYQKEKVQAMKVWYDYNRGVNFISRTEVSLDNERFEVTRLKNKGEILAYQYSLYQSYFQEAERLIELEKECIEKEFSQRQLYSTNLKIGPVILGEGDRREDNFYLERCNLSHPDYSQTAAYRDLIHLLPRSSRQDSSTQKLYFK